MRRELRTYVVRALAYGVVLELLLAGAILFWPDFKQNIGTLKAMVPFQIAQDIFDTLGRSGVEAYVNLQHFFKGCNTLGAAAAVLFAMGAVAGEAHRGTLEIWLARPLSRRRILLERYACGALALVAPVLLTTASVPWLLHFVGESIRLQPLMLCALHESLFLLAIYSAAFCWSSASDRPWSIAFGMLFFAIAQFALYAVKHATHYSLFRLADVFTFGRIFDHGALDWRVVLPLLAFCGLCLWLSLWSFARRVP